MNGGRQEQPTDANCYYYMKGRSLIYILFS
ncbi:hypothetical protein VPH184E373B_0158 [Vibrio phage 184E37-3b]